MKMRWLLRFFCLQYYIGNIILITIMLGVASNFFG